MSFYVVGVTHDILGHTKRFQGYLNRLPRLCGHRTKQVQKGFENGPKPSKVNLEFDIPIGGEAGLPFVTKGIAQANIKVSVKWQI